MAGTPTGIDTVWHALSARSLPNLSLDDGAGPIQRLETDHHFLNACRAEGLHFELRRQPSQSPDLNIIELQFCRSSAFLGPEQVELEDA
jgi:hypothetical protein